MLAFSPKEVFGVQRVKHVIEGIRQADNCGTSKGTRTPAPDTRKLRNDFRDASKMKPIATLIAVYLFALAAYAAPTTQPETRTATPGPLVITAGGYYSGTFTTCSIRTQAPITLNAIHFVATGADTITSNTSPSLRVLNCTFDGTAPHYSLVLWSIKSLDVEHCRLNGGGGMVCMGNASSVHFVANDGINISGATSATSAEKTSFIQLDQIHCGEIYIGWNRCTNTRGKSAVEDVISMNRSGGTSASPAIIENNLVDGEYEWPVGSHPSGSGLMLYDPAASGGSSEGGWTIARNNSVLNCANVGIDAAGSHGIQILNNIATAHGIPVSTAPMRTWRWIGPGGGTPVQWFGPFIATGNQASWFAGTKQLGYAWAEPQTAATGNTMPVITDDQNRAEWAARVKAAAVVIGPVPPATNAVTALSHVGASPEVQAVPLPKENLGPAVACGYTVAGSWIRYSALDFGSGVKTFTSAVATTLAGQSFSVHLDSTTGPLIATLTAPKVAGWYAWTTVTSPVAPIAAGTHDIYLVFAGSVNVKSFVFGQ